MSRVCALVAVSLSACAAEHVSAEHAVAVHVAPTPASSTGVTRREPPTVQDLLPEPAGRLLVARDPFRALHEPEPSAQPEGEGILTAYALEQLQLVGVVSGVARPVAMVQSPDGQGHTLQEGMLVGSDLARVRSIRRTEVTLERRIRDRTGRYETVLVPWKLEG